MTQLVQSIWRNRYTYHTPFLCFIFFIQRFYSFVCKCFVYIQSPLAVSPEQSLYVSVLNNPTRQDVHERREDDLFWARIKVFRTSLFVADVEKTSHRRRIRIGRTNNDLRTPWRKRTSGKIKSSSRRHVRIRRTMDDPCPVGWWL